MGGGTSLPPSGPEAPPVAPPPTCAGAGEDAAATPLDFTDNVLASPAPPGGLTPENAPQIVVFGWDDVENEPGMAFVNELLGTLMNPDGSSASCNLNPNACYAQGWGDPSKYGCGDGSLSLARPSVTQAGFQYANHTIDHLESNSTWTGIPAEFKSADPDLGGWLYTDEGKGPGVYMDQALWQTVLQANETALTEIFPGMQLKGFRAPRLEINDDGLQALKAQGYEYDMDLEELLPEAYVEAVVSVDTGAQQGFNWVPWPYTLDNGSRGIWIQHRWGDKDYLTDYPAGLWSIPVYMLYASTASGLGTEIANQMLAADQDCVFPEYVPEDQRSHCYLSEGELNPGDVLKEITSFDFNTFIYGRTTKEQWLELMQYTFLARFYGNRAPLTYGTHPVEYTAPYDEFTLAMQGNNYGYRNVLDYNTYMDRQQAMRDFVNWVKNDPVLSQETYFMSAQQLTEFMRAPFDKTGAPAAAEAVATPASNGVFSQLTWTDNGIASMTAVDGNSADFTFTLADIYDQALVAAGVTPGSLANVTHIDIQYTTEVPFYVRLLTPSGTQMTVLLSAVGGNRTARIRVRDFSPAWEASAAEVTAANHVDAAYMATVNGIGFEAAGTEVTGTGTFNTHIEQITFHGAATTELCQ
jgi:hypothetical protein